MTVVWTPRDDAASSTQLGRFLRERAPGEVVADDYAAAWDWSVSDLAGFWEAVWDHFDVETDTPRGPALANISMPGADWFPGASINYARHMLAGNGREPGDVTVIARSQTRPAIDLTLEQLRDRVARARRGLQRLGVDVGDRVAAYMPNIPETLVAFLATASLGAVWSSVAPEFGTRSVVDRLSQIEPKVLLAIDGYRYGDRDIDRRGGVAAIRDHLPGLSAVVGVGHLDPEARLPDALSWDELLAEPGDLSFQPVGFQHPLYVLFSSGTTGLPKPIIHGHGGILLEHLKMMGLLLDLRPNDRFFWFTTTGWMMWNFLISGSLVGAATVMFDGNPGHPDLMTLWELIANTGVTYAGVSAPFLMACAKADVHPREHLDLSAVRGIGSTGSPLPDAGFDYVVDHVSDTAQINSTSGGTDVCTAFVGASPLVEVRTGEIACRALGCKVEAYDSAGNPVVGDQGELVITAPMPSMPVGFWGDDDGSRLREAYFEHFPGVWRHGDWITITERGSCIITGRSDATLNRGGVRLGTSEFYAIVDAFEEVGDCLVVHVADGDDPDDSMGRLMLFIAPAQDHRVDDDLRSRIATSLRRELSPRHVPDELIEVPAIPRTLSGKRLEVPIKRILTGTPVEQAVSPGALSNPSSLDAFVQRAARHN